MSVILLGLAAGSAVTLVAVSKTPSNYALEYVAAHQVDGGSRAVSPKRLSEVLPLVGYRAQSGRIVHLSTLVATGEFKKWRDGKAYTFEKIDPQTGAGTEVAWSDPAATARTILMTFYVTDVLARDETDPTTESGPITVEFYFWGKVDYEQFASSLIAMGNVAPIFSKAANAEYYSVTENDVLILQVGSNGGLTLPVNALIPAQADYSPIAVDLPNVEALRAAGRITRTIPIIPE